MDKYISKDEWLAGVEMPTNDFNAIPADADLRALAFVGYPELSCESYEYDSARDYCEGR